VTRPFVVGDSGAADDFGVWSAAIVREVSSDGRIVYVQFSDDADWFRYSPDEVRAKERA
jgi:hypothetical protein